MSVIRVEKTKNYTTMSNYHFKEKGMSLKAKGLLSLMLSLPDDWDYTISGLVTICKENETAIKSALKELQEFGYLQIIKNLPTVENNGRISYDYIVYEKPIQEGEKQGVEILPVENPRQLNTNILNTNNINNSIINNTIMEKPKSPFTKLENNIEEKPKKRNLTKKQKNAIECNKILETFIKNEVPEIQQALKMYVEVRKSKGLQPEQLKLILNDFEKEYNNKPLYLVLDQIKKATTRGWLALVYNDNFTGTTRVSYSSKPNFDNTSTHNIPKGVASMTAEEKKYYEDHELAKDENGNFIKF